MSEPGRSSSDGKGLTCGTVTGLGRPLVYRPTPLSLGSVWWGVDEGGTLCTNVRPSLFGRPPTDYISPPTLFLVPGRVWVTGRDRSS